MRRGRCRRPKSGGILLRLVVLAAAKLVGEVAEHLCRPAVLGELLAGILLGPTLLAFVDFADAGDATLGIVRFVRRSQYSSRSPS